MPFKADLDHIFSRPSRAQIRRDLDKAQLQIVTTESAQFYLFTDVLRGLTRSCASKRLEPIVRNLTEAIEKAPVDIGDASTHGNRAEQVNAIQSGLQALDRLQPGAYDRAEELAAIKKDADAFQRRVDLAGNSKISRDIVISNMLQPTVPLFSPPKIINLLTCENVRNYVRAMRLADYPDLWIRHRGLHDNTVENLSWSRPGLEEDVQGQHLDYINLTSDLSSYVVVLRHHVKNQGDIPYPIGIPLWGANCACNKKPCEDLKDHLQNHWPKFTIIRAIKIADKTDVIGRKFDTSLVDPYSNNLCVFVEDAP